jgi:type IV secretory pathway TrbD component
MEELKMTPISPSINRPILLMGCERVPLIWTGIIVISVILPDMLNPIKLAVAIGIWFLAVTVLRLTAKKDPNLLQIYFRRLKYKAFYPAFSRVFE